MCCICKIVNNIKHAFCNCGRSCGCDNYTLYRSEPRTRITCANTQERCFEPCVDDDNCGCRHQHQHHHGCGCDY